MNTASANPNTNCLAGMACPKCGDFGPFKIFVTQSGMVRVADDGTDFIDGNVEWEDGAACECLACGHEATVAEFSGSAPVAYDEFQRLVIQSYAEGDYADFSPAQSMSAGDSLLVFLLSELSEKEGCTSVREAIERLDDALEDLEAVRDAFAKRA